MPRSLWNGTVSIGPVHVPVKLFSAVQDQAVHFHEVHLTDGARIEHKRVCTADDEVVPNDEIVKGFEVAPDEFVVLEPDEIKAAAGPRTRVIDVEHFVPAADVDPVFFEKPYVLGAQETGSDAYRVLHDALERTGRLGIGRLVWHNREELVAVGTRDGLLALHVLRFAEEVVDPASLELDTPAKPPGDKEIAMASKLVETLHKPFDPAELTDPHREAVQALVKAKAKGEDPPDRSEPEPEPTDDLLAALEASLAGSKA